MKEIKVQSCSLPQAEQIVAKLMMNMAAVDRRLAEEASRQNMVSYNMLNAVNLVRNLVNSWEQCS